MERYIYRKKQRKLVKKQRENTASDFLGYVLYAFGGIGLELLLLKDEEGLHHLTFAAWGSAEHILHWCLTCVVWGMTGWLLARQLPAQCEEPTQLSPARKVSILFFMVLSIVLTSVVWGGFKPAVEFSALGPVQFLFQYLYYATEVFLMVLMIAHGQRAFEVWKGKDSQLPFGGMFLALTWGMMHLLTQNVSTGIYAVAQALIYGEVYLLARKDRRISYLAILWMFML